MPAAATGGRQVARSRCRVFPFDAENPVDPAVLVCRQTHVVNVGCRFPVFGHGDGIVPETEIVDAVRRLRHGEKRFAVGTFHANHQEVFAAEFDGSRVHHGIYPYPFHAVGIGRRVEVVAPEKRRVRCREYRMAVSGEDTVVGIGWHIFACQELLVLQLQPMHRFLKVGHCRKLSLYCLLLKGVGCIGRE